MKILPMSDGLQEAHAKAGGVAAAWFVFAASLKVSSNPRARRAASRRGQGETRNGFRLTYSRKVDDVVYRRTN
jgi:hypothetical protein